MMNSKGNEYAANRPGEILGRAAGNAKDLFLQIKPAYWGIFMQVMLNHGGWENLLAEIANELRAG